MLARATLVSALMLAAAQAYAGQNIVIVLDDSGSMGERMRSERRTMKIDAAKTALRAVLEQLPADSRVGLVVLNGGQRGWLIPLGPADSKNLDDAINRIRAGGGTPLGQFMKIAADALLDARAEQVYGTYRLLIVTDGEAGDQNLVENYLPDIVARGLVVDVIGVDMRQDHSLATKVQTYRRADDSASLQQAISEVVLGETTADNNDAGESDFETLQGLPDEVAVAALDALAEISASGNFPIGQRPAADLPPGNQVAQAAPRQPPGTTAPQPSSAPSGGGGGATFSTLIGFCCLGSMLVVFVLAVGVMLVIKK